MTTDDTASPEGAEHSASPESSRPDGPVASSKLRRLGSLLAELFRWDGWLKIGGVATALTAVAALFFTAKSLQSTRDQYGLSEEGQVTDRFSKAVEHLGSDKIDVRLGGIYSLERLARDSPKDQPMIIEILSAFVRTQAPADGPQCVMPELVGSTDNKLPLGGPHWNFSGPLPKTEVDVQAAVTVLGRRDPHHDAGTDPDLINSCLPGVRFTGSFVGANFFRSKLAQTVFYHVDLRCALFVDADLSQANLMTDKLNRAWLDGIKAKEALFVNADMRSTDLTSADLQSAVLAGANLSGADLEGATLTDARLHGGKVLFDVVRADANFSGVHYSAETKWPADYKPPASTDSGSKKFTETPDECLRAAG
jgi:hypothetical protein